jgi:hypothetical protein
VRDQAIREDVSTILKTFLCQVRWRAVHVLKGAERGSRVSKRGPEH